MVKQEAQQIAPWIDLDLGILYSTPGIGIARLWQLPVTHPFFRCAVKHDCFYDLAFSGHAPYPTSEPIDKDFLKECLEIANGEIGLITQAYFFYGQCRIWGLFRWSVNGDPATLAAIKEAREKSSGS